ncbi:MAG: aminoglycoside phosphotransferase [Ilumatobacteraceae bacterium]|nr:aminoglycoside phosphotransferase [Ilumatobacteraceae bacterium]
MKTALVHIPGGLSWLQDEPTGAAWLSELPRTVEQVAELWDLEVGEPFPDSTVGWVAPVLREAEPLVVKIQWPHPECEHEAAALATWAGDGAIELVAHDPERHALLLERCAPGTHLARAPGAEAMDVMASLLPRLWKHTDGPFKTLEEEADGWRASINRAWDEAGRPCERRLVDAARTLLADLGPTQGEQVLVHQDLHGDNVLAAQRSGWLAIDPKPLTGEREFSCAPIIRSFEFGHSEQQVMGRLDRLSAELGLDHERVQGWAIAQTMAWSFSSAYAAMHFATARWLLNA